MSRRVQSIQKTGKFWKLLMLVSVVGLVWGLVKAFSQGSSQEDVAIGVLMAIGGFLGLIVAKAGAWWFHG